jgi:threonine dehydratase
MSAPMPATAADEVAARISAGESAAAAEVVSTLARHTPLLTSHSLSERCGGRLLLKAENLQRTGSFKLRGAVHKISRLKDAPGVVAGSAGNHGQSLAYAARAKGLPCEVFMPLEAPVAKVAAVEAFGGIVHLQGDSVDECVAAARARAAQTGAGFVHPFTFQARATIADGIAIKRPGDITLPLVRRWVDEMVVVSEEEIANAMVWLLERSKLVVEGGGAAGVAALLAGKVGGGTPSGGATVVVLSGGNVDAGLLAAVAQRNETLMGRRIRLFTRISDRPGGLAALLTLIAEAGGNVVHADHVRDAVALHVRETGVEITLETRSPKHSDEIVAALQQAGYEVRRVEG